jgi:hypothetical protein
MLASQPVQALVNTLQDWPGPPLKSHKKAGHSLHLLSFIAEIGFRMDDPGIESIVERVMDHQAANGAFQISLHIRKGYGGSDQPQTGWMLCDAPLVAYALCALGLRNDPRVGQAIEQFRDHVRENGWPCVTGIEGGFRGPGRKDDPCPYATLLALKALAAYGTLDDEVTIIGIETLLWHWEVQKEKKLYLFGIGTDFRKPKLPLIWYDILHVLDVLSRFPGARQDARYQSMLEELMVQADAEGRFTPASMYMDWKAWEFADKKNPSPAITLMAWRAVRRGM